MLCDNCAKRQATTFIKRTVNGQTQELHLCPQCAALDRYARQRSDRCPFMETKTFCSNCKVHCYRPEMRESIRAVMVFSGPRMIFHHPLVTVRHMIENKKETRRLEKTR